MPENDAENAHEAPQPPEDTSPVSESAGAPSLAESARALADTLARGGDADGAEIVRRTAAEMEAKRKAEANYRTRFRDASNELATLRQSAERDGARSAPAPSASTTPPPAEWSTVLEKLAALEQRDAERQARDAERDERERRDAERQARDAERAAAADRSALLKSVAEETGADPDLIGPYLAEVIAEVDPHADGARDAIRQHVDQAVKDKPSLRPPRYPATGGGQFNGGGNGARQGRPMSLRDALGAHYGA